MQVLILNKQSNLPMRYIDSDWSYSHFLSKKFPFKSEPVIKQWTISKNYFTMLNGVIWYSILWHVKTQYGIV